MRQNDWEKVKKLEKFQKENLTNIYTQFIMKRNMAALDEGVGRIQGCKQ